MAIKSPVNNRRDAKMYKIKYTTKNFHKKPEKSPRNVLRKIGGNTFIGKVEASGTLKDEGVANFP